MKPKRACSIGKPRRFVMGGHPVTVEYRARLMDEENHYGKFREIPTGAVVIDSSVCDDQQEETLIHEMIEAANRYAQLDLEHGKIQILAMLLHQAIVTAE